MGSLAASRAAALQADVQRQNQCTLAITHGPARGPPHAAASRVAIHNHNRPYMALTKRRAVERCTFDQARLIRHNRILAKNGIAPDGESDITVSGVQNILLTWSRHPSGPQGHYASVKRARDRTFHFGGVQTAKATSGVAGPLGVGLGLHCASRWPLALSPSPITLDYTHLTLTHPTAAPFLDSSATPPARRHHSPSPAAARQPPSSSSFTKAALLVL